MLSKYFFTALKKITIHAQNFELLYISLITIETRAVYQRIENPCVSGSIPPRATKKH